jgi:hypothetical protein
MMENRRGWRLTERANGGGEVGHEQGVLADRWMAPGRPETGGRGRRARCARGRPNRGGGEADWWVAATVPGSGTD